MALDFVKGKVDIFALTHFLCIPIMTAHSRPQLEQTLNKFKNDPTTPKIPAGSYRPLQTLHIPTEVLNLSTEDRVAAACHHLRSLEIDRLLSRASKGAQKGLMAHTECNKESHQKIKELVPLFLRPVQNRPR